MKVSIIGKSDNSYELFINTELIYTSNRQFDDDPKINKEENYSMTLWYLANYCAQYYEFEIEQQEEENV